MVGTFGGLDFDHDRHMDRGQFDRSVECSGDFSDIKSAGCSPQSNQVEFFLGQLKANPAAKAIFGAFGGVTGLAGALLALRSKFSQKLSQKGSFQWLLVAVAVVFL